MTLLNSFDIHKDFFSTNPELSVLLKDFLEIPSEHL
jgi:hypothetical protein